MILLGRFLKEERGIRKERGGMRRAAENELRRKTDANIISRATRERTRSAVGFNRAIWVNFLESRSFCTDI